VDSADVWLHLGLAVGLRCAWFVTRRSEELSSELPVTSP